MFVVFFVFFFSSRRRHTRWNCDWSSDVCSSDLLPPGHGRPPVYGPEEVALLRPCWQIADYVCSKRLAPFLSELLGKLSACGELSALDPELVARVAHMSPATIDRALAP